jgi:hypothetical protein
MQALRAEAAKARAASQGQTRAALPLGEPKREDIKFGSEFRAELVEKDGQEFYLVEGYASMAEKPYEMWDMFGPYNEVVSASAFDRTLAAKPMVVFRFNHGGTAMATTANGRLELSPTRSVCGTGRGSTRSAPTSATSSPRSRTATSPNSRSCS